MYYNLVSTFSPKLRNEKSAGFFLTAQIRTSMTDFSDAKLHFMRMIQILRNSCVNDNRWEICESKLVQKISDRKVLDELIKRVQIQVDPVKQFSFLLKTLEIQMLLACR